MSNPVPSGFSALCRTILVNMYANLILCTIGLTMTSRVPTCHAGGDDDVEPPPSPTKVDRQGDEIMMLESKAKMLFQVNGDWKDMGVGSLSLRQAKKDAPVCLFAN